jgi:hypothetical protein
MCKLLSSELDRVNVYLTAVGGGVFENELKWIQYAIVDSLYEYRNCPLNVKLIWHTDIYKDVPEKSLHFNFNENIIYKKLQEKYI